MHIAVDSPADLGFDEAFFFLARSSFLLKGTDKWAPQMGIFWWASQLGIFGLIVESVLSGGKLCAKRLHGPSRKRTFVFDPSRAAEPPFILDRCHSLQFSTENCRARVCIT